MEEQLKNILGGCEQDEKMARTSFSIGFTHVDRRLHQMFFADRDYERFGTRNEVESPPRSKPKVQVEHCKEKGYSVVNVKCKDRPKLMFDIVCTLTDMQYIVFHATITSGAPYASQSILSGTWMAIALSQKQRRKRVVKCLEAAILRRPSEGVSLELCAKGRVGLLSEATRILREHGLTVLRAGVSTVGQKATNVFYVQDASGNPVDAKTIETLRKEIGHSMVLNVKKDPVNTKAPHESNGMAKTSFFFGALLGKFLA